MKKDLLRLQTLSLVSRLVAMAIGIVGSVFTARILTVAQFGIKDIAESVGGSFGIYQHLGLASGSTRQISSSKNKEDAFKIFVTSVVLRYLVSIPIAAFLFFFG